MATPIVWPKARKKEYIAPAKGTFALETEAWQANPWAEKSMPVPKPETRQRKIQEGVLVDSLR